MTDVGSVRRKHPADPPIGGARTGRIRRQTAGKATGLLAASLLALSLLAGACTATRQSAPQGVIEPSYVFPLGANKADVLGMLGHPQRGPRFDRYSTLTEVVYSYPFRAIRAETRLPDGTTRVEMADTIHFFFNQKDILDRMALRTNRYYSSFTDLPVHKVTILPRLIDQQGRPHPVTMPPHLPQPAG